MRRKSDQTISLYKRSHSPYYQARIEVLGTTRRVSTGEARQREALEVARRLQAQVTAEAEGALQAAEGQDRGGIDFATACDRFFHENSALKPSTVAGYQRTMPLIYAEKGNFRLAEVDRAWLVSFVEARRRAGEQRGGLTDATIRRNLRFLSTVMAYAVQWADSGVSENPVLGFLRSVKLKEAKVQQRALSTKSFQLILAEVPPVSEWRLVMLLLVGTGMRHGEVAGLTWLEVDFEGGLIRIDAPRTKTQRTRSIPLPAPLLAQLLERFREVQLAHPDPREHLRRRVFAHVSESRFGFALYNAFKPAARRAGFPNARPYDLRHCFASWSRQSGLDSKAIDDMMGHLSESMSRRYGFHSDASLQAAASRNRILHGVLGSALDQDRAIGPAPRTLSDTLSDTE